MSSRFKVVLLGEGRVGKTSLLLRYTKGTFSDKQQSTIQASFLEKRMNIGSKAVQLAIWDTAGQERFHALGPIYYRDSNGAVLVYDITDRESFTKVQNWVKELKKIVGDDIIIVIAGNKGDLEKNRQVPEADADAYAQSVGATHFKTSAKSGMGVEELFLSLTRRLLETEKKKPARMSRGASRRGGGRRGRDNDGMGPGIVEIDDKPKKDSKCC